MPMGGIHPQGKRQSRQCATYVIWVILRVLSKFQVNHRLDHMATLQLRSLVSIWQYNRQDYRFPWHTGVIVNVRRPWSVKQATRNELAVMSSRYLVSVHCSMIDFASCIDILIIILSNLSGLFLPFASVVLRVVRPSDRVLFLFVTPTP